VVVVVVVTATPGVTVTIAPPPHGPQPPAAYTAGTPSGVTVVETTVLGPAR
jgi:hypothetical protein